jgi:holo-[acyl-carrier protein] synthase
MTDIIGVGLDLVDVDRFARTLERRPSLAQRLFTEAEQSTKRPERLAVRFAAKEAVMKALGSGIGSMAFRDIEVVVLPSGAPTLVLHGRAAEIAASRGVRSWQISLSHTDATAGAVVIAQS